MCGDLSDFFFACVSSEKEVVVRGKWNSYILRDY